MKLIIKIFKKNHNIRLVETRKCYTKTLVISKTNKEIKDIKFF